MRTARSASITFARRAERALVARTADLAVYYGTYRAVRRKHIVRTLAEFEWRFNYRVHLATMIPVLGQAAVNTCPVTYADLKWADYGA